MKLGQIAAVVAVAASLAGCLSKEESAALDAFSAALNGCLPSNMPLISDAVSATSFKKITFGPADSTEPSVAILEGKSYLVSGALFTHLRFKEVDTDLYLAEASGGGLGDPFLPEHDEKGMAMHYHWWVKLDRAKNTAGVHGTELKYLVDDLSNSRIPADGLVTSDDVALFILLAKARMAAEPFLVFEVKLE